MSRTCEELKELKELMLEIRSLLLKDLGTPTKPGMAEYARAMQALLEGNKAPLAAYIDKGGEIPKAEEFLASGYVTMAPVPDQPVRRRPKAVKGMGSC